MLDAADQKIVDNVAKYGWHGVYVPEDDEGPGFSFSVGFWETLAAPEVIVFSLHREVMHNMLWEMFRRIRSGKVLIDHAPWSGLIDGFDCVSRPVHGSQTAGYLGTAIWYQRYRTGEDNLSAFQLFWPGKMQGLYPWDAGCDDAVRRYQPTLYLPKEQGIA